MMQTDYKKIYIYINKKGERQRDERRCWLSGLMDSNGVMRDEIGGRGGRSLQSSSVRQI